MKNTAPFHHPQRLYLHKHDHAPTGTHIRFPHASEAGPPSTHNASDPGKLLDTVRHKGFSSGFRDGYREFLSRDKVAVPSSMASSISCTSSAPESFCYTRVHCSIRARARARTHTHITIDTHGLTNLFQREPICASVLCSDIARSHHGNRCSNEIDSGNRTR